MEPRTIHQQPAWLGAWLQLGLGWVDAAHRRVHNLVRTRLCQWHRGVLAHTLDRSGPELSLR
jgi:hypothetical protein